MAAKPDVIEYFAKGNPIRQWNPFAGYAGGWEWVFPGDIIFFDGPEENYRIPDPEHARPSVLWPEVYHK